MGIKNLLFPKYDSVEQSLARAEVRREEMIALPSELDISQPIDEVYLDRFKADYASLAQSEESLVAEIADREDRLARTRKSRVAVELAIEQITGTSYTKVV
ncbi:hypothetical protein WKW50_16345 [Ochrobactrum sp. GPK 3]